MMEWPKPSLILNMLLFQMLLREAHKVLGIQEEKVYALLPATQK